MKKALALALSITLLGGSLAAENTAPAITASAVTSAVQTGSSVPGKTEIYAFSNKDKSISIRWRKAENAEGYNIYRYSYNSKKWSKAGTVKSTETLKFTDTGLASGSAYTYKVKPYTTIDGKRVENNECTKFSTVTKPRAVKVTGEVYGNFLKLEWSKANCSGYRIYSYRNGKWKLSARVSRNKTSFTYKNLSKKNYSFRVVPVKRTSKGKVYKSTGNATLKVNMAKNTSYTAQVIYANKGTKTIKHKIETKDGMTFVDGILIVNKTYSLPSSYNPGNSQVAYNAFEKMSAAAANDGITLFINSGFRSYSTQEILYNGYAYERGTEEADRVSARPGHSEHQTGLTFDVNSTEFDFEYTNEAKWLAKHCAEYGFIVRYPKGKEKITGYAYEPWHIRYLGVETAKKVTESGLCLEEYLGVTSDYKYAK